MTNPSAEEAAEHHRTHISSSRDAAEDFLAGVQWAENHARKAFPELTGDDPDESEWALPSSGTVDENWAKIYTRGWTSSPDRRRLIWTVARDASEYFRAKVETLQAQLARAKTEIVISHELFCGCAYCVESDHQVESPPGPHD